MVGVNGAGKSTILDAISTALGSYIVGFDGIASNRISHDDAHRKMYELGSRIEAEEQYPVEITAFADLDGRKVEWKRSLHAKNGRTHISEAKSYGVWGKTTELCSRRR
ncbi:MAG: ATP-binding protein [Anaerocolumna sp.]